MRADRLLRLLHLLQRHGRLSAPELAEHLEVSVRTVLRDMEALSAAGVPVYTERGRGGGCVLLDGWRTEVTGLTPGEAQALFAWSSRGVMGDLGLGSELGSGLAKLAAAAPPSAMDEADALAAVVVVDRRRWFAVAETVPALPVLRDAALHRRRVRIDYRSNADAAPRPRVVDPHGLVENAGRWYLVAARDGQDRSYRVSRIEAVQPLDETFVPESDLDLTARWEAVRTRFEQRVTPVTLEVLVAPRSLEQFSIVAGMQLASGATLLDRPDLTDTDPQRAVDTAGWTGLALTVRDRQPALALVLVFGGDVVLLSPADVVRDLRDRAAGVLQAHRP